jgi:colanic acid/amylovoran biosynthesis protein
MKTVITNTQMSNGGDAAILYAIVETMRRAHLDPLDITIIDPLPHVARRHYPEFEFLQAARYALDRHLGGPFRRLGGVVNNLRDRRLSMARRRRLRTGRPDGLLGPVERAALSAYESADLVISTGGTYLVDNYDISGRLFELELVALAGKAPVFYTQSLGPFHKPGLADALRRHFEASPLILLRDQRSREALRRLGIPDDKIHVLADCVFAMASPDDLDCAAKAQTGIRRVAVSVRNWTFFEGGDSRDGMRTYMGGIADAVERLVRTHSCDVVFLDLPGNPGILGQGFRGRGPDRRGAPASRPFPRPGRSRLPHALCIEEHALRIRPGHCDPHAYGDPCTVFRDSGPADRIRVQDDGTVQPARHGILGDADRVGRGAKLCGKAR